MKNPIRSKPEGFVNRMPIECNVLLACLTGARPDATLFARIWKEILPESNGLLPPPDYSPLYTAPADAGPALTNYPLTDSGNIPESPD